ncbi:MAG: homoserine dehydrogenase [Alicyclobacillus sp.]|nr:homoserine dehydrogenase [Alicyclobacillus sp.]
MNAYVGVLGCGTVGTGVLDLISRRMGKFADAIGRRPLVKRVLVRDLARPRSPVVDVSLLTDDAQAILADPDIQVVIEVMGGIEPARTYLLTALRSGKHVVTANKDLLAVHGDELRAAAADANVSLLYEAAVAGAIPVLRPLQECLMSNDITSLVGIVNGTCNYILSQMAESGADFTSALADAQARGFAEADPSSDVDGWDAARKLVILATLAFQVGVQLEDVFIQGIRSIAAADIAYARELGHAVKLLVEGVREEDGVHLQVRPTLVPLHHPLAHVSGANNALYVHGDASGELMFYGTGAGSLPTASAVVGDLYQVLSDLDRSGVRPQQRWPRASHPAPRVSQRLAPYFVRLRAADVPGAFAQIATVFAERDVSMETVLQRRTDGARADVVIVTHPCSLDQMQAVRRSLLDRSPLLHICNVLPMLV